MSYPPLHVYFQYLLAEKNLKDGELPTIIVDNAKPLLIPPAGNNPYFNKVRKLYSSTDCPTISTASTASMSMDSRDSSSRARYKSKASVPSAPSAPQHPMSPATRSRWGSSSCSGKDKSLGCMLGKSPIARRRASPPLGHISSSDDDGEEYDHSESDESTIDRYSSSSGYSSSSSSSSNNSSGGSSSDSDDNDGDGSSGSSRYKSSRSSRSSSHSKSSKSSKSSNSRSSNSRSNDSRSSQSSNSTSSSKLEYAELPLPFESPSANLYSSRRRSKSGSNKSKPSFQKKELKAIIGESASPAEAKRGMSQILDEAMEITIPF